MLRGKKHTIGGTSTTNSNIIDGYNSSGIYTTASGKGIYNVSDIFLGPVHSTTTGTASTSANNSPGTEHIKTGAATAVSTTNNTNTSGSSIFSFLSAPR